MFFATCEVRNVRRKFSEWPHSVNNLRAESYLERGVDAISNANRVPVARFVRAIAILDAPRPVWFQIPGRIDGTSRNGANEILICSIRASSHSSGPDLIILPICLHIGPGEDGDSTIRNYRELFTVVCRCNVNC